MNASWGAFVANGPTVRKPCLQANRDALGEWDQDDCQLIFTHTDTYKIHYTLLYGAICHTIVIIILIYNLINLFKYVEICWNNVPIYAQLLQTSKLGCFIQVMQNSCMAKRVMHPEIMTGKSGSWNCMTQPFDPTTRKWAPPKINRIINLTSH